MSLTHSRRTMSILALGLVVLVTVPALAYASQRTGRADQRAGRRDEYRDGAQRPRTSSHQPIGAASCQDAAHGAGHERTVHVDEHLSQFCNMFPAAEATHTAIGSGSWSNPGTWKGGLLPTADGKVFVPANITVTVDRELSIPLFWIRVEGMLRFSAETNSSLIADTIKVESTGRIEIGTAAKPIAANRTARVVIKARDGNPIDHNWDPLELSRGLIAHGLVEMHGAAKTPFVTLSEMPRAGATSIVVKEAPSGWMPGDILVLTATEYDQDETFTLVRVEGLRITVDRPIRHTRVLPAVSDAAGFATPVLHLGNFSRNVQIRSAAEHAGNPQLQGHMMLMHRGGHKIAWVGFHDMGRTTIKPVTDPRIVGGRRDAGVNPAAAIPAENVRGRYSLHFHGTGPSAEASLIEGCAIEVRRGAGLKIGVANHSSHVNVRGCVSHNVDGSHYFTEEGDERGEFRANLAIHSVGSGSTHDEQPRDVNMKGDPELQHRRRLDVGHRGTGFWLNGGGVDVLDNVSAGQAHSGFHVWSRPLNFRLKNTFEVRFPVANLRDRSWAGSWESLPIETVPIRFIGNTAYVLANGRARGEGGFLFEYHGFAVKSNFPKAPYSQMHDLLSWNATGLKATYAGNMHFKNVRVIGNFSSADDVGARLGTQGGNNDLIENLRVEGFLRGVSLPRQSVIRGGFFSARVAIPVGGSQQTTVDLNEMRFGTVPATAGTVGGRVRAAGTGQAQYDLYIQPFLRENDFNPLIVFAPRPSTYVNGHPAFPKGAEVYTLEQMPDYVLPDFGISGLFDGKTTTREAWEKYRLAPGGKMAPAGAVPLKGLRSNAVFGEPVEASGSPRGGRSAVVTGSDVERGGAQRSRNQSAASRDPNSPERQTRQDAAVARERRAAERAARDSRQAPVTGTTREEATAAREARRSRTQEPNRQSTSEPSAATGPGWELAPKPGGGMTLVRTSARLRLPAVSAGGDQTIALADGGVLRGVVGSDVVVRWSRAYGPGSVEFADPAGAQTQVKFSAPGVYVLHLTVENQAGLKNTASVTVAVVQ